MKVRLGSIDSLVVQRVGNKALGDGIAFSSELCPLEEIEGYLMKVVEKSFKYDCLKCFSAIDSLEYNTVYRFVSKIFDNRECLIPQANNLARHLYEQSIYPNIKSGEFYVAYFKECQFGEEMVDAVGLFKSESKETVLKVQMVDNSWELVPEQGLSLRKLDKGCLVFNTNKANGYKVAVVDGAKRKNDVNYWTDCFLNVIDIATDYNKTVQFTDFLMGYMRHSELHEDLTAKTEFVQKVRLMIEEAKPICISDMPDMLALNEQQKEQFLDYSRKYEEDKGGLLDSFTPISGAISSKQKTMLNKIKLGKDFEVKLLSSKAKIEYGKEENSGCKYCKLFYDD